MRFQTSRSLAAIVALTAVAAFTSTSAPGVAGLVNTPAPGATPPSLVGGSGGAGDTNRPLPPVPLQSTDRDGWFVGIGQDVVPHPPICGQAGSYLGRVVPGQNVSWVYHFEHSDGRPSQPVLVPAAPRIPGAKLGGKTVYDPDPPTLAGMTDSLVVTENGQAIQSPAIAVKCRK